MEKEHLKALKKVVNYLWEDEQKDYADNQGKDGHIFESVIMLQGLIEEERKNQRKEKGRK